jgi:mannitol-1-phosphate 5-dehydrogenase
MNKNVIFGAGKISRGFLAHLLYLSGEKFVFVEKDPKVVELVNRNAKYGLYVFGAPEKNIVIEGVHAISSDDVESVKGAIAAAELILISVGGKNLKQLVPVLAGGIESRFAAGNREFLNIITCENWYCPADTLHAAILKGITAEHAEMFEEKIGISEAAILRTAIEADRDALGTDPLALNVSDFWDLPIDGGRLKGKPAQIKGFRLINPYNHYLDRKLYTFNSASATVSYLGYLKNHDTLADAIRDEYIEKILMGVYEETGRALCKRYDLPLDEHKQLQKASYEKYRDRRIVDLIERNARDPVRKLGPDDRLLGPARMVIEYGGNPENLATAIAAAVFYDNPQDPIALQLRTKRENQGVDSVLTDVCKIDSQGRLALLIKENIGELKRLGLVKGK